ncbi:SRPBCC family protein [Stieleria varia]|uniref:Polyketide cyclase / dehydrase and lipid transport n=2 Tax=Stieleria varia TaxID=2528005 RepID=A0A5C6APC8_9BACT|nr:Polyketide cyclase / dehydrase and lipid transport [Stieleria varia]
MPCYNSIVVDAPIDKVWDEVRDFHQLEWGRPFITSVTAVGEIPGDRVGAKRVLNGAFEETLQELDESRYKLSYSIDEGPEPVSSASVSAYIGSIRLLPITADDATFVQWTSQYQADNPQLVADFLNPIYAALLACLRDYFQNQTSED